MIKAFDFGSNWKRYSRQALTVQRVEAARQAFADLTQGIELKARTFLDVGFGQGLTSLCASSAGAKVHCLDVNPGCAEALALTSRFFPTSASDKLTLITDSILSETVVTDLLEISDGGYDVVHSWGVLHHTGNLARAYANCAVLVRPGGYLIVAIYNRHWSSPLWKQIKRLYCLLPSMGRKVLVVMFIPVIYLAKFLVTGKNPFEKERGMDFFFDVVDWVGGYPYEYASIQDVVNLAARNNLELIRVGPAGVPTGCNEFVFVRLVTPPDAEPDH